MYVRLAEHKSNIILQVVCYGAREVCLGFS